MQENANQNNSEYGHFSRSVCQYLRRAFWIVWLIKFIQHYFCGYFRELFLWEARWYKKNGTGRFLSRPWRLLMWEADGIRARKPDHFYPVSMEKIRWDKLWWYDIKNLIFKCGIKNVNNVHKNLQIIALNT